MEGEIKRIEMVSYRDFFKAFRKLNLGEAHIIAHASLSAFGPVQGGPGTIVGALLSSFNAVLMPTFTYKTMITPEVGPPDNGINYGSGSRLNREAEFFRLDMPADPLMGAVAETIRNHPDAIRSNHPIYSFSGVNVAYAIQAQTLQNPFAPIEALTKNAGWVLLLGVDHTSNTSIHYAEQEAGRRQFTRWAITPQGIITCPRWPGCSYGFNQVSPMLTYITRSIHIGNALVQAVPLQGLVEAVIEMLTKDPLALLCKNTTCSRCNAIRSDVLKQI
jgi:aminoglycoside 3-N-acetyltransferase